MKRFLFTFIICLILSIVVSYIQLGVLIYIHLDDNLTYYPTSYQETYDLRIKLLEEYSELNDTLEPIEDVDNLDYLIRTISNNKFTIRLNILNENGILGRALLPFGVVCIDKTLYKNRNKDINTINDYIATLMHEYIHMSHYSLNERYTEFTSFKLLYESNNLYLKRAGIWSALASLRSQRPIDYDYNYYLLEYFN